MQDKEFLTYKKSGVDLDSADETIRQIKKAVFSTFNPHVLSGLTSYAGLFQFEKGKFREPVLVSSTDGVGTKLMLAKSTGLFDGIGQDLVAMCLNDILCCGAVPLFFLDYIACGKIDPGKISAIVRSIARSCRKCQTVLIGGETAEMPGIYKNDDIDLAGFAIGVVEKSMILRPGLVKEGDTIMGLPSSGVHSNGFSLVRKILGEYKLDLNKNYGLEGPAFKKKSLGEILLIPTRIYFDIFQLLVKGGIDIRGMAHITGGGFYGNINRIIPSGLDAKIEFGTWPVPSIFAFLQKQGNVETGEMFRVFNMGIGMAVIVDPGREAQILEITKSAGEKIYKIGQVIKGTGKVIINLPGSQ